MGYIRNAVLIEAPVDEVFKLTNNVRTWPTLFTEYLSSEVLEETEDSVTFRLTTHPDENGQQWSWVAHRQTNLAQRSTYSERKPSSGPFERMVIRWQYDAVSQTSAVMTWEQTFTMKPDAPVTEEQATNYLQKQTKIQQQVIKERVECLYRAANPDQADPQPQPYRGIIIGRYLKGSETEISDAFQRSDATELPHLIGVKSRHIWVLDDIYVHFVEGNALLPKVIKEYAAHPLFKKIKAEVDVYVKPLTPEHDPGVGHEIYRWTNAERNDASWPNATTTSLV